MHQVTDLRRPVAARRAHWVQTSARMLARMGVRPNHVSVASVLWAALAGVCLLASDSGPSGARVMALLTAAVFIQLRLLCNLLDGLLAVEGGLRTKSGVIFNELPDRFSDAIVLVCAGYAATPLPLVRELGWAVALLAVLTAYVRALGGASGASQDFAGPMAKPRRMALLSVACLIAAPLAGTEGRAWVLVIALALIGAGSALTVVRRTLRVVRELEAGS